MRIFTAIIAPSFLLSACFPYATTYTELDVPGAVQVRQICSDFGPPVVAIYQVDGIEFEVSLDPMYYRRTGAMVVIRAPASLILSVPNPEATIKYGARTEKTALDPRWIVRDGQGKLISSDTKDGRAVYKFAFAGPIDVAAGPGEINLPPVWVNGRPINSPPIKFTQRGYAGVLPLNC